MLARVGSTARRLTPVRARRATPVPPPRANPSPAPANVALVKGLYEAYARGDIPAILAASAPDIDWNPIGPGEEIPLFKRRRGVDEVAAFFGDVAAAYDFSEFTPRGFYGVEDKV